MSSFSAPHFEPFKEHPSFLLKDALVTGPLRALNPTRARYGYVLGDPPSSGTQTEDAVAPGVEFKWRSRDNRKGRHTIAVDPHLDSKATPFIVPPITSSLKGTLNGIKRMFTYYPIWDVSYLVAQCFTWGSVIFVINGFFYWLPLVAPSTEFPKESEYGGGITSFIGTVFFQVGVVLLMFEAINVNRTGCFGWALEQVWDEHAHSDENLAGDGMKIRLTAAKEHCWHHQANKQGMFAYNSASTQSADGPSTESPPQQVSSNKSWIWYPSWYDLKTHYFHEIGFLSALIYFVAGTIFWIIGFTSLPGIYDHLSEGAIYGVFWTPDLLGSIGFIVGSYLIMVETQPNWYTPAPKILGWHIGLWNVIGSIGFALSAIFGIVSQATGKSWCLYQADLSTTWGSIAFLFASVVQWYESVNKNSVEKM